MPAQWSQIVPRCDRSAADRPYPLQDANWTMLRAYQAFVKQRSDGGHPRLIQTVSRFRRGVSSNPFSARAGVATS